MKLAIHTEEDLSPGKRGGAFVEHLEMLGENLDGSSRG
jgi:hypothetical protein